MKLFLVVIFVSFSVSSIWSRELRFSPYTTEMTMTGNIYHYFNSYGEESILIGSSNGSRNLDRFQRALRVARSTGHDLVVNIPDELDAGEIVLDQHGQLEISMEPSRFDSLVGQCQNRRDELQANIDNLYPQIVGDENRTLESFQPENSINQGSGSTQVISQ